MGQRRKNRKKASQGQRLQRKQRKAARANKRPKGGGRSGLQVIDPFEDAALPEGPDPFED